MKKTFVRKLKILSAIYLLLLYFLNSDRYVRGIFETSLVGKRERISLDNFLYSTVDINTSVLRRQKILLHKEKSYFK